MLDVRVDHRSAFVFMVSFGEHLFRSYTIPYWRVDQTVLAVFINVFQPSHLPKFTRFRTLARTVFTAFVAIIVPICFNLTVQNLTLLQLYIAVLMDVNGAEIPRRYALSG